MIIDNGKEFTYKDFKGVLKQYGMKSHTAPHIRLISCVINALISCVCKSSIFGVNKSSISGASKINYAYYYFKER